MSKLEDIAFRLEWFSRHSDALEKTGADLRRLVDSILVLPMDPRVKAGDGGLHAFFDAYQSTHERLSTDLYPQGVVAVMATSELLYEAGKSYATTEGQNHDLSAEVARLLEDY